MIYIILIFGLFLRLIALDQSFWLDEAAQTTISASNLLTVNWGADFQPPIFYLLTHLWQRVGETSEWFLRLPSVVFGVLTIYILYLLVKKCFNTKTALVASLLLATAPYHIYYSQEYRMYSLLTLLITASWYVLIKRKYAWYSFLVFLSVYTHYFAFISLASQVVYFIVYEKKTVQKVLQYAALGIAPFVLWLPVLVIQFNTARSLIYAWPRWSEVAGVSFVRFPALLLAKFTVGMTSPEPRWLYAASVIVAGSIFLYSAFRITRTSTHSLKRLSLEIKNDKRTGLFLAWLIIPTLLAWVSGLWISANAPHRLLFVLPAFYVIITLGLNPKSARKTGKGPIRQLTPIPKVSMILFVILLASNIYFSYMYLSNARWHREDWRSAVTYTDQFLGKGGIALTEHSAPWAPMNWYSRKPQRYIGASDTMQITDESIARKLDTLLVDIKPRGSDKNPPGVKRVILYTYLFEISDPYSRVEQYLLQNGYKISEEKDFHGVGIVKVFTR